MEIPDSNRLLNTQCALFTVSQNLLKTPTYYCHLHLSCFFNSLNLAFSIPCSVSGTTHGAAASTELPAAEPVAFPGMDAADVADAATPVAVTAAAAGVGTHVIDELRAPPTGLSSRPEGRATRPSWGCA